MRGFTLLEVLVVIVILGIAAALILPNLAHTHPRAYRAECANNLGQIGKALTMYADVPSYATFPTDKVGARGNPLPSLGMLYRDYISDYRVFSCPQKQTINALKNLGPTVSAASSSVPLDATMTHYGYDPGNAGTKFAPHTPNDSMAVIVADFTAAGQNSDNHGPKAGQNVMLGAGSVEWRDTIANTIVVGADGKNPVIDSDITADNGITDTNWMNMESYISQ